MRRPGDSGAELSRADIGDDSRGGDELSSRLRMSPEPSGLINMRCGEPRGDGTPSG